MKQKLKISKPPPVFIFKIVEKFRNFLKTLHRKMIPSDIAVLEMVANHWVGYAVYAAASIGVADKFNNKPKHISDLARETKTDEESLYRLMRLLASQGIFKESKDKVFTLTPMANNLKTASDSVRNMIMFQYADYFQRGWGNIVYSIQTGQSALENTLGLKVFEYFKNNPQEAVYFNNAMTYDCLQTAVAVEAVYDFSTQNNIVDFGGGHGALLAYVLSKNSDLQGILFDLPHVVEGATEMFQMFGVEDRVQIVGGDFFKTVPEGGDIYIGRNIIHDWNDEQCISILNNICSVMGKKSKLLIIDTVISKDNNPSFGKMLDLNMLVASGGKERTKEQYEYLLQTSGFKLNKIITMVSPYSIVEAIKV